MAELPSQEYLKSRIDYNPETGEARWKPVDESFGPKWRHFNSLRSNKAIGNKPKIFDTVFSKAQILYKLYHGVDPHFKVRFADGDNNNFSISNLIDCTPASIVKSSHIPKNISKLPENVRDLLEYDHTTGTFSWKPRGNPSFDNTFLGRRVGRIDLEGYHTIGVNYKMYKAHRLAWYLYYDTDPVGYLIDHINGVRNDNIISNLRLANNSLNTQASCTNARGFRKNRDKYYPSICINDVQVLLGVYNTPEEARQAYEEALARYKPVYQFTEEEQALLDELYQNYPNVTRELQHRCHELQVKALNHYIEGAAQ